MNNNEPTRHFLHGLLSRRDFLVVAGGTLATASLLDLIGCGGNGLGGPGNGIIVLRGVSGTVTVPAGVDPKKLIVAAGTQTSSITSGGFTVSVPTDAPSLVTVLDPQAKNLLFMGMIDPTSGSKAVIDSTSTAVALLFFALGGSSTTRDGMKPLLDAIKSNSATTTFASVVASRIAANPFAVGAADAQIVTALATAANAIAPTVNKAVVWRTLQSAPTLLLIQPTGEVNGVTYVQADTGTGFAVQNAKRRLGFCYTYLTGHVDVNGVQTDVSPPQQVGAPLEIPATSSLLNISSGWAQVKSATVPLNLQGSDSKSIYTMVYLTQVYGASTPAFFSDPMWAGEISKWNTSLATLGQDTFVGYFANILFSAMGFGGLTWASAQLSVAIANLTAIPSVSVLLTQAAGTNVLLGDLANAALREFLASDIASLEVLKDIGTLLSTASAEAAAILEASAMTVAALAALQVAIATFLATGAILLAADLAAVALDTTFGDKGDLWTGTVVQLTVRLSPQHPTSTPGSRVRFAVSLPAGITGTIQYDWTQTSAFATFSAADGTVGNKITTSSTSVDLVTTGSDTNPITVTVKAYKVTGSTRTEIGVAQTTVTMSSTSTGSQGRIVETAMYSANQSENVWVWGIMVFTPKAGVTAYKCTPASGIVTEQELAGGAPIWDPTINPNTYNSIDAVTAYGGYSSPYAEGFFYNLGGGQVGYPVYHATLSDQAPYPNLNQMIADAKVAAQAAIDASVIWAAPWT